MPSEVTLQGWAGWELVRGLSLACTQTLFAKLSACTCGAVSPRAASSNSHQVPLCTSRALNRFWVLLLPPIHPTPFCSFLSIFSTV